VALLYFSVFVTFVIAKNALMYGPPLLKGANPMWLLHVTSGFFSVVSISRNFYATSYATSINESINHYFSVQLKVDQRAGQLNLPQIEVKHKNR